MKRKTAVDLGGTKISSATIFEDGTIADFKTCATPSNLMGMTTFLKQLPCAESEGIAFAVAGVFTPDGTVLNSPNAPFLNGLNLIHITKQVLGKPAKLFNDMESAGMGMRLMLPDLYKFIALTWSSGVGVRIVEDMRLISKVMEAAHTKIDYSPFAALCGCKKRGHIEGIIGGKNIEARVKNEAGILGIKIPEGLHPCEFLGQEFIAGKPWAVEISDMVILGMAGMLANIISLYQVTHIVYKGTFGVNAFPLLWELIKKEICRQLIDESWATGDALTILESPQPLEDALLGAAYLFDNC